MGGDGFNGSQLALESIVGPTGSPIKRVCGLRRGWQAGICCRRPVKVPFFWLRMTPPAPPSLERGTSERLVMTSPSERLGRERQQVGETEHSSRLEGRSTSERLFRLFAEGGGRQSSWSATPRGRHLGGHLLEEFKFIQLIMRLAADARRAERAEQPVAGGGGGGGGAGGSWTMRCNVLIAGHSDSTPTDSRPGGGRLARQVVVVVACFVGV